MSNKFPGFVQITPEHARAIQFDVQLYCIFLSDDDKWVWKIGTPEIRRAFSHLYDDAYWSNVNEGFVWYIKVDDDKLEYTPTNFEEPQR